ncbi:MAG TPA: type II toxin-antitoxin system VapC family toxin [Azospirillaceae bacterium]|nr:type II toxin-antitoxin system VapC family toxin [Azospirillaceae bacterium]
MMVLDASMALSWLLDDEANAVGATLQTMVRDNGAVVPGHWHLEVANSLSTAVRRRRITNEQRRAALDVLSALPLTVDPETSARAWTDTLALADRFGLTLYDAAYLELAARRKLPLATLDGELRQAAAGSGVPLLGS